MLQVWNENPDGKRVGDCVVRTISTATGQDWESTFIGLAVQGLELHDMPSSNAVWGTYLRKRGWKRKALPDTCPACYTVRDFAEEHRDGTYIVACDGHVVCVKDGVILDTWDSQDVTALFYWEKE